MNAIPHPPFPETADIHTASDEYATRFAGPTGAWMLSVQESITRRLLGPNTHQTILDVGGGHGQLASPLCTASFHVTVLGSDPSCAHRIQREIHSGSCHFQVANLIDLPFPNRSFDAVICFRLLTHCHHWTNLIRELCRVARHTVIVDYPTSQSLNSIAPLLFGAKRKFEGNTRTWRLFKHREVHGEFLKNGFYLARADKQFFLPMVLHRMLKNRPLSSSLEALCRYLGLTRLAGSPVIASFCPIPTPTKKTA